LKEDHKVASTVGSIAGTVGGVALGGGVIGKVGKAAEGAVLGTRAAETVGVGRRALATAAKLGAEGGAMEFPRAITEASLGDPGEAAEHLVAGVGIGAVLGGVGSLAASATKGAVKGGLRLAEHATGIEGLAERPIEKLTEHSVWKNIVPKGTLTKEAEGVLEKAGTTKKEVFSLLREEPSLMKKPSNVMGHGEESLADYTTRVRAEAGRLGEEVERIRSSVPSKPLNTATVFSDVASGIKDESVLGNVIKAIPTITAGGRDKAATLAAEDISRGIQELKTFASEAKGSAREGAVAAIERLQKHVDSAITQMPKELKAQVTTLESRMKTLNGLADVAQHGAETVEHAAHHNPIGSLLGGAALVATGHPILGIGYAAKHMIKHAFMEKGVNAIPDLVARYGNQVGLALSDAAVKTANLHLERITTSLVAGAIADEHRQPTSTEAIGRLTGQQHSDPTDALKDAAYRLDSYALDPQRHLAELHGMTADGAPTVAPLAMQRMDQNIQYLRQQIPRPPPPEPFAQPKPWKATPDQADSFARKADVVNNPHVVVGYALDGTLHKDHVDALKERYPATFEKIRRTVMTQKPNPNLSYGQQQKLQMLFGEGGGTATKGLKELQASFNGTQPPSQQGGSQGGGGGSKKTVFRVKDQPSQMTEAQRISSGQRS
jgi:hypothetical protein